MRVYLGSFVVAVYTGLALGASTASVDPPSHPSTVTDESLAVYAELVKETELRRRVNVLYPNPQTIFDGLQIGYVSVRHGNLTFRRRDIVSGTNPLARIVRVYDSRIQTGRDFGPGWRLSLAEQLTVKDGSLVYTDGSGARHYFARSGTGSNREQLVSEQVQVGAADDASQGTSTLAPGTYTAYPPTPQHASTTIEVADSLAILRKDNETRVFESSVGPTGDGSTFHLTHLRSSAESFVAISVQNGLISEVSDADGSVFEMLRDRRGRIVSIQDRWGRVVDYRYDASGRLGEAVDIAGNAWAYEYAAHGQLTRAIGPNERDILRITYDEMARVRESHSGRQYSFAYTPTETIVSESTGHSHEFGQNAVGVTYRFDSTNGIWWQLEFDERNRVTVIQSSRGGYRYTYGSQGEITNAIETTANGNDTRTYQYDDAGRIASVYSQDGTITTIDYANGSTRINDPLAQFAFEVLSSGKIAQVEKDGTIVRTDYDADGNLAAFHNGARAVNFDHDSLGRISAIQYANGAINQYQYDQLGNRSSIDFGIGGTVRYKHDPAGNIVEVAVTEGDGEEKRQSVLIGDMNRVENIAYEGLGTLDIAYDRMGRAISFDIDSDVISVEYTGPDRIGRIFSRATGATWSPSDDEAIEWKFQEMLDARLTVLQNESSGAAHPDYGIAAFDESSFAVEGRDPMSLGVPGLLEARQVFAVADPLFSGNERDAMMVFEKPSNAVFQPLEYRSTNCCICIPTALKSVPNPGSVPKNDDDDDDDTDVPVVCICLPTPPPPPPPSISIVTQPPSDEWYIDNRVNMPNIRFVARLNNVDPGTNARFFWKLLMEFEHEATFRSRTYRRYFSHTIHGVTTVPSWSPRWGSLIAGANEMTVSVIANVGGSALTASRSGYEIHGENPTKIQIFGLATTDEYKAVCWQESWHKQFGDSYTDTPYVGVELPLYGGPDGWGLMHEDPLPSERHLWDWRTNLRDGIAHLDGEYTAAFNYLTTWYDEDEDDPTTRWSWNPRNNTLEVWNEAFARYNTGDPIFSINGNGGVRNCSLNQDGCAYSNAVRGHINNRPWNNY